MIYEKKIRKTPIIIICLIIAAAFIIPYSIHGRNESNYSQYCDLGNSAMGNERYSDAIMYFNSALEFHPENSELKQKILRAGTLLKSKEAFEKGLKDSYDKHYDVAIKDFETVDKSDEDRYKVAQEKIKQCRALYVNNFVEMAKSEVGKGNIEVAINYLDKAIIEDPTNSAAVTLRSQYTLVLQQKAEEEAQKQLAEQKKNAQQNTNQSGTVQNQGTSTPTNSGSTQPTTQPQGNQPTTP